VKMKINHVGEISSCTIGEGHSSSDVHYIRQRKGENKVRVTVDDLINIICEVDKAGQRDSLPTFCAVQRSRIPVLVDEVSDIAAMRTEISQ